MWRAAKSLVPTGLELTGASCDRYLEELANQIISQRGGDLGFAGSGSMSVAASGSLAAASRNSIQNPGECSQSHRHRATTNESKIASSLRDDLVCQLFQVPVTAGTGQFQSSARVLAVAATRIPAAATTAAAARVLAACNNSTTRKCLVVDLWFVRLAQLPDLYLR